MVICDNEYETKENKNWTKDKIELQHIHIKYLIQSKNVNHNVWIYYLILKIHVITFPIPRRRSSWTIENKAFFMVYSTIFGGY